MPYANVPEEKWEAMDRCVESVMEKDGVSKDKAIAICHNSIVGAESNLDFTVREPNDQDLHYVSAQAVPGEILVFENARLARDERNANGDFISVDNLHELAASMPLMPMMDGHPGPVGSRMVGVYTKASVADLGDGHHYLLASGFLYPRREPEITAEIIDGRRKQSIEAVSELVTCSKCGREYASSSQYCEHLRPITMGMALSDGVSRSHRHMRARGAAAVHNPAGGNTGFGDSRFIVIAGELEESDMNAQEVARLEEQVNTLQASNDGLREQIEALTGDVSDRQKQIDELTQRIEALMARQQVYAERVTRLFQSGMDADSIAQAGDAIADWDEKAFELIADQGKKISELSASAVLAAAKPETKPEAGRKVVADGDAGEPNLLGIFGG